MTLIKEYDIIFQKLLNFEGPKGEKITKEIRRLGFLGLEVLLEKELISKKIDRYSNVFREKKGEGGSVEEFLIMKIKVLLKELTQGDHV